MSAFGPAARLLRIAAQVLGFVGFISTLAGLSAPRADAGGGTLTVGMTAGDIPVTTGNPDQGFEGYRFVGYNLYDTLVLWDLSKADKPSEIKPGLATSWEIDPNDHKRWIVHLREGVKWHDGCPFTADDVVWNIQYRTDKKAPFFFAQQFAYSRSFLVNVKSVSKIDDHTVAFETNFVESLFPYSLSYVMMISRCRAQALHYDWAQYALHPSGTGPYRFDRFVPHQRLEFVPNTDYWDKARIPKQDRLVLIPMPEASTRTAALLAGQVDWIEAPSPDAIPRLKASGMKIVTNVYPHDWPYMLNFARGPFKDLRVRQAANYAINRKDVVDLLGGTAIPGAGCRTAEPSLLRPSAELGLRSGQGAHVAERGRLSAVQGHLWHLDIGIGTDAALADERAGQIAARSRRFRSRPEDDGLERAARSLSRRRRQEPEL